MKKCRMKTVVGILLALSLLLAFSGCKKENDQKDNAKVYKVAMIFSGPINDNGWNTSAYNGLVKAEETLNIETAYSENVAVADAEAAMIGYAAAGYDLIVAHGYEYTDAALNVAPDYSSVNFAVFNGTEVQEPNVCAYDIRPTDTGFLAGVAAGILTESNTVGIMVMNKSPKMQKIMDYYVIGAKYANKEVEVLTAYTDTGTDVSKGEVIANTMIEQGADIVTCNSNAVGIGSIGACEAAGIHAIGMVNDQHSLAPETVYVSTVSGVSDAIERLITDSYNGDFKAEIVQLGVPEGIVTYSSWYEHEQELPAEKIQKINEICEMVRSGQLDPTSLE